MAVAQHGGQGRVLDAFGIQEGRQRFRVGQRPALETQGFEGRADLGFQIGGQDRGAVGVLAFGGHRQAARQQGAEGAGIETLFRLGDGMCAGHDGLAPVGEEGGRG
ncbi:hypothetical protein D9M68_631280 [compost metagenome]